MEQLVWISIYSGVILWMAMFFVLVLGPRRYCGVIAISGFTMGFIIGVCIKGIPEGIYNGIFIGIFLDLMLFSGLLVRFYRSKSIEWFHRYWKDK